MIDPADLLCDVSVGHSGWCFFGLVPLAYIQELIFLVFFNFFLNFGLLALHLLERIQIPLSLDLVEGAGVGDGDFLRVAAHGLFHTGFEGHKLRCTLHRSLHRISQVLNSAFHLIISNLYSVKFLLRQITLLHIYHFTS